MFDKQSLQLGDVFIVMREISWSPFGSTNVSRVSKGSIVVVINIYPSKHNQHVDLLGSQALIPWTDGWANIEHYLERIDSSFDRM